MRIGDRGGVYVRNLFSNEAELLETNAGSEAGARGPLAPDSSGSTCLSALLACAHLGKQPRVPGSAGVVLALWEDRRPGKVSREKPPGMTHEAMEMSWESAGERIQLELLLSPRLPTFFYRPSSLDLARNVALTSPGKRRERQDGRRYSGTPAGRSRPEEYLQCVHPALCRIDLYPYLTIAISQSLCCGHSLQSNFLEVSYRSARHVP